MKLFHMIGIVLAVLEFNRTLGASEQKFGARIGRLLLIACRVWLWLGLRRRCFFADFILLLLMLIITPQMMPQV
jgi:hypothetical protein